MTILGIDVKHACELVMLARFSYYHRCHPRDFTAVIGRLRELAGLRLRYAYRRLGILLKRKRAARPAIAQLKTSQI